MSHRNCCSRAESSSSLVFWSSGQMQMKPTDQGQAKCNTKCKELTNREMANREMQFAAGSANVLQTTLPLTPTNLIDDFHWQTSRCACGHKEVSSLSSALGIFLHFFFNFLCRGSKSMSTPCSLMSSEQIESNKLRLRDV